jgi:UDP-N-acetylmuramoylalanine--D-glutamate ligase
MTLVVGLGKTGLSCVRYFAGSGVPCAIADTRSAPPGLADVERDYPHLQVRLGRFDADWFATFERLIVSPGVAVSEPAVQAARRAGSEVIGDIELFARNARAPVVAITGSNGKSTVTTLVERLLAQLHRRVLSGANLGRPVLELLDQPVPDYYVLELSSFQLETLASLRPAVAAIVNVTPDHMDRYASQRDYVQAKARIYRRARRCIYNADDAQTAEFLPARAKRNSFTLRVPRGRQFGIRCIDGRAWLAQGKRALLPVAGIGLRGRHNLANILAACAIVDALGLDVAGAAPAITAFSGLPHRMQSVCEREGVQWINDSKGTNVGATVAALKGLTAPIVLIAGGEGKGADFAPLRDAVSATRAVILIGRDAPALRAVLQGSTELRNAVDMRDAVTKAAELAQPGDVVLLSPACASFDMFDNYQQRGDAFVAAVRALSA